MIFGLLENMSFSGPDPLLSTSTSSCQRRRWRWRRQQWFAHVILLPFSPSIIINVSTVRPTIVWSIVDAGDALHRTHLPPRPLPSIIATTIFPPRPPPMWSSFISISPPLFVVSEPKSTCLDDSMTPPPSLIDCCVPPTSHHLTPTLLLSIRLSCMAQWLHLPLQVRTIWSLLFLRTQKIVN
jgi:hypothetical protein